MDIEKIIKKNYSNMDERSITLVISWLKRTEKLIGNQNPKTALSNKDFLCQLFCCLQSTTISMTQYTRIKRYLKNILEYYHINKSVIPTLEEVQDSNLVIDDLFGDLESIFDLIDSVGLRNDTKYFPQTGFVRIKSIAILAWHGLLLDQIGDFKKTDIVVSGEDELYIRVDDKLISITPQEYSFLSLQAESDYIDSPSGRLDYYTADSEFLIRNKRGTQGADKKIFCNKILKRFSQEVAPKQLGIKQIRYSGYFYRIWCDNEAEPLVQKIQRYTNCTLDRAYAYRRMYNKWVQTFHPEEI